MRRLLMISSVAMIAAFALAAPAGADPPLPGAVFTTDSTCTTVNGNIYDSKDAVNVDGGPKGNQAGLPDGSYYVQVTDPSGATVLGTSVGTGAEKPYVVVNGVVADCYQLSAIVAHSGTPGYLDTPNDGGEYKVWISTDATFVNNSTKTDNFKVKAEEPPPPDNPPHLSVTKFYDANTNGVQDGTEPSLFWRVHIFGAVEDVEFTPFSEDVDPGTYTVTEDKAQSPPTWVPTTPTSVGQFTLGMNDNKSVEFGNVCLGAGGGHTLGFWSNPNGKALMADNGSADPELALLAGLNLRNANGYNPGAGSYAAFRTWLLSASATNMAYMLSAQLAAMELNVEAGIVNGSALVFDGSGFTTINNLMAAANTALGANGLTLAGSPDRAAQEALKNTLDSANNNVNFVQANPCAYTFASLS
jgi:hypothetical protein